MTLAVYAAGWLRDKEPTVRPSTLAFYRASLLHLNELGGIPLDRLTPQHIRDLIGARRAENYASRTIRGVVQTLALILRRAEVDGLVTRNVAAIVELPKLEQAPPRHFTVEQVRRFLDAARGDRLASLYAVAFGTGLRRGELLALTWREVDLRASSVTVRAAKTSAGVRVVFLPGFSRAALEGLEQRPGPIWSAAPSVVSRSFRLACRRAGLPELTFHATRHTFASLSLDAGVDPLVLQQLMGHSKVSQTGHYARSGDALRRAAVEALGASIGGEMVVHGAGQGAADGSV